MSKAHESSLRRVARALPHLAAALGVLSCRDQPSVAPRVGAPATAHLTIAPAFQAAPPGAPKVDLSRVRGVLVGATGDSTIVETEFTGDVAILAFEVRFAGESATYSLDLTAFDTAGVAAYHGSQVITLKPGNNPTIAGVKLVYAAPDAALAALHVAPATLTLDGGASANLDVAGSDAHGRSVASIRVGWTSRNPSIAAVDAAGKVHAGRFQGETYIVARTLLDVADSALVKVRPSVDRVVITPAR